MDKYELGRVILWLRILYPMDRDQGFEAGFTRAPSRFWDVPGRTPESKPMSKRSGCVFEWETTVPDLGPTENEFFDFLTANAEHLRRRPDGCIVLIEFYCYMEKPRFLVQLSSERVALIASVGSELCVETYTRSR